MSEEILELKKLNVDTVTILKYEVQDRNGSTLFMLSSATWDLRQDGSVVLMGACTCNNTDQDAAGNTIKTASITLDLNQTDGVAVGMYNLNIFVMLTSGENKRFMIPIEVVDIRGS